MRSREDEYSNLLAQVKEMGAAEDFEEIKSLYKDANDLLGNIVKLRLPLSRRRLCHLYV